MNYLILSTSLSPNSKSRTLARALAAHVDGAGQAAAFIDLVDGPLPMCDASQCYGDPRVVAVKAAIERADGIVLATPVYNYTVCASAKNLLELTGKSWTDKVVAFLCAAGGPHSYMSVMGMANSMMLDFRTIVVPRFVYATGKAFTDGVLTDADVDRRVGELAVDWRRMTEALRGPR